MDWSKLQNYTELFLGAGLSVYGAQTSASGYTGAADTALAMGQLSSSSILQGGQVQAESLRQSGLAAQMMADYNSKVIDANRNQQLKGVQEQVRTIFSSNIAAQGASGISTTSRSFLAVANATISRAESDVQAINNTANQQIATTKYQGQIAKTAYENQARVAEWTASANSIMSKYQSEISASQQQYQADTVTGKGYASAVTGLLRGATSLLGS